MKNSLYSSDILDFSPEQAREKLRLTKLIPYHISRESPNCQLCEGKIKDKSFWLQQQQQQLFSEFCGKSVCKQCLIKKRRDPEHQQTWHKICQKCEGKCLALILQQELSKMKQSKAAQIEVEQSILQNQREILYNLKNNIEQQTSSQQEKTSLLKIQDQEADNQIVYLEQQIQDLQNEKDQYMNLRHKQEEHSQELQYELNNRLQSFNDMQFELKKVQDTMKNVEQQIKSLQLKIDNKTYDDHYISGGKYKESILEGGDSGLDSIFRNNYINNKASILTSGYSDKAKQSQNTTIIPPQAPSPQTEKGCYLF